MRIGVLGTGSVGQVLGGKLVSLGHEVKMGSRTAGNEKAMSWVRACGPSASEGSFAEAAGHGEIVINATSGQASLSALNMAGADGLRGKVLLDVANALSSEGGFPPALTVANTDSLAEQIQRAFPETRVVKSLNTVHLTVMVEPALVPGDHVIFLSGDDPEAKAKVSRLLNSFGWPDERILDLGGISSARGPEMYLALWIRMMPLLGADINIELRRKPA
jgi:predicted dinucleotide-binding enzyme